MKRTIAKVLTAILITSSIITPSFADIQLPVKVYPNNESFHDYDIQSNRYYYVYEETPFRNHTTAITTEQDIEDAMKLAAHELNLVGYIFGGLAVKPISAALASNVSKKTLISIVKKSLINATAVGITERIGSFGLTELELKAAKRVVQVKHKYQYQVNRATGSRRVSAIWVTYKTDVYHRSNPYSSWQFSSTETTTTRTK